MESSENKIKFSFTAKPKGLLAKSPASSIVPKKHDGREKIECIENNTIKSSDKKDEVVRKLLVIPPPKPNKSVEQIAQASSKTKRQTAEDGKASSITVPDGNETLEQRAARELVEESAEANVKKQESSGFVVPLRPEMLPLDGARQSTLDDYETVPIEQFGMGMLRGMGFKGDPTNDNDKLMPGPAPRPKGLGLGAERAVKESIGTNANQSSVKDETLVMKTGAPVKITAGRHKGKYGVNGAPEHIVLFDWQVVKYCTPIIDLVYFIFCCTDGEFRARHYDEMMNIYYGSLSTLLEKLGHNPQEVFPRTAFLRQLRQYGRFGLMLAVFLVPMICTRNEDLPDMDATAEMFREADNVDLAIYTKNTNQDAYRKRMSAVIRDTVRYGYI